MDDMNINKNKKDLIFRFLKEELTDAEEKAFWEKYNNDKDFRDEAQEFGIVASVFQNLSPEGVEKIENYLNHKNKEKEIHLKPFWTGFNNKILAAAAILIFISLGWFFLFKNNPSSTVNMMAADTLMITLTQENLGFTEKASPMQIPVLIYIEDSFTNSYQYLDTLKLFLNVSNFLDGNLYIKEAKGKTYLVSDTTVYFLKKGLSQKMPLHESRVIE